MRIPNLPIVWWLVWLGLAALTVVLLYLLKSTWGKSGSLRRCILLSLLAHVLLVALAASVQIVSGVRGSNGMGHVEVEWVEDSPEAELADDTLPKLAPHQDSAREAHLVPLLEPPKDSPPSDATESSYAVTEPHVAPDDDPRHDAPTGEANPPDAARAEPVPSPVPEDPALMAADSADVARPVPQPTTSQPVTSVGGGSPEEKNAEDRSEGVPAEPLEAVSEPTVADAAHLAPTAAAPVPSIYRNRLDADRERIVEAFGGNRSTEAAVDAALRWLAENQGPGGRWLAARAGGSGSDSEPARDAHGIALQADTGVSGLALLAFLGAGHTHQQGPHQQVVQQGIGFLLGAQRADGYLGGGANVRAGLYCHAMAGFALSEAYGLTRDPRLETPILKAARYTQAAQHPTTGGWRYLPGDTGDTSQLGWQAMVLRSSELAGISMPAQTRLGIEAFLRSVSCGARGGLASYMPRSRPTRAMTAEALVCRQILGLARNHPAEQEAVAYILEELPGQGRTDLYYWYYATLAMFQVQGEPWNQWNHALKMALISSQRLTGPLAGSWDADAVWGTFGGRVYNTALAALCLEAYYRYLPLAIETAQRSQHVR
jgi:hypothetical protein